jgi:hypothetical protein
MPVRELRPAVAIHPSTFLRKSAKRNPSCAVGTRRRIGDQPVLTVFEDDPITQESLCPDGDRPKVPDDIRRLILEMSIANALWGAPGNHGELLKLEIDIGQTRVATLLDLSSQSCRRYRINRHVRCPHDFISAVAWTSRPAAFAEGTYMAGCDHASDCVNGLPAN